MPTVSCPRIDIVLLVSLVMYFPSGASAQSPITIEQLLAKPSSWQINSSISYRSVLPESGQFERQSSWLMGMRYGVNQRFEINAGLQTQQLSQTGANQQLSQQSQRINVGSNWLIKTESTLPAVLLEVRAVLANRASDGWRELPGGQIALTTYKSIDPLVLSLSTSMSFRRDYRLEDLQVKPGVSWTIEPAVNFAVNTRVTLFGGAVFERRNATRFGSSEFLGATERLGVHAGMALSLKHKHSVFASVDLGTDRSGGMSVQWFYEF